MYLHSSICYFYFSYLNALQVAGRYVTHSHNSNTEHKNTVSSSGFASEQCLERSALPPPVVGNGLHVREVQRREELPLPAGDTT